MMGMAVTVVLFVVGVGLYALWRWTRQAAANERLPLMYQSAATVKYSITSQ